MMQISSFLVLAFSLQPSILEKHGLISYAQNVRNEANLIFFHYASDISMISPSRSVTVK